MRAKKIALWVGICAAAATATTVVLLRRQHWRPRTITLQGAVIRSDDDPRKQVPVPGAVITISDGTSKVTTVSNVRGYFEAKFHGRFWPQDTLNLAFRRPDYEPLYQALVVGIRGSPAELLIARMTSTLPPPAPVAHPQPVSDIRVRYTVNEQQEQNVGSEVRVFQVENKGNVRCQPGERCSPNGLWKAAEGSVSLDAGQGHVFRNVRVSCIAGPCPFTHINEGGFKQGGQNVVVSALDWSDTATFLIEAEVFDRSIRSTVRESYPVIYGRDLHFTAPPTAEGVAIEADVNGTRTVYPLGPYLYMSWGICNSRKGEHNDTIYECELKPGYHF